MHIKSKNTFVKAAFTYFLQNKAELQQLKTPLALKTHLRKDERLWQTFLQAATKDSISIGSLNATQKNFYLELMEARIGRQLWRKEGYYKMSNLSDPMIDAALNFLAQ
jgi:hypothetical protein